MFSNNGRTERILAAPFQKVFHANQTTPNKHGNFRGDGAYVDFRNFSFKPLEHLSSLRFNDYVGPTLESNWVVPGVLLVGAYPATEIDSETFDLITSILKLSITKFVCLQQEYRADATPEMWRNGHALRPYFQDVQKIVKHKNHFPQLANFPNIVSEDRLSFDHCPIVDCGITDDSRVLELARKLVKDISHGEVMYLHCWGGHGRTGTVVCIMLHLMYGLSPNDAMIRCQTVHDMRHCPVNVGSPQTQSQRDQVVRIISGLQATYVQSRAVEAVPKPLSPKLQNPASSPARKEGLGLNSKSVLFQGQIVDDGIASAGNSPNTPRRNFFGIANMDGDEAGAAAGHAGSNEKSNKRSLGAAAEEGKAKAIITGSPLNVAFKRTGALQEFVKERSVGAAGSPSKPPLTPTKPVGLPHMPHSFSSRNGTPPSNHSRASQASNMSTGSSRTITLNCGSESSSGKTQSQLQQQQQFVPVAPAEKKDNLFAARMPDINNNANAAAAVPSSSSGKKSRDEVAIAVTSISSDYGYGVYYGFDTPENATSTSFDFSSQRIGSLNGELMQVAIAEEGDAEKEQNASEEAASATIQNTQLPGLTTNSSFEKAMSEFTLEYQPKQLGDGTPTRTIDTKSGTTSLVSSEMDSPMNSLNSVKSSSNEEELRSAVATAVSSVNTTPAAPVSAHKPLHIPLIAPLQQAMSVARQMITGHRVPQQQQGSPFTSGSPRPQTHSRSVPSSTVGTPRSSYHGSNSYHSGGNGPPQQHNSHRIRTAAKLATVPDSDPNSPVPIVHKVVPTPPSSSMPSVKGGSIRKR